MRLARLIGPELETLLSENPAELGDLLDEIHPEDVADILSEFDDERAAAFLTEVPTSYAAQVFERLDEDRQAALALLMGINSAATIATEMDADERVDFVASLAPELGDPLLQELHKVDPTAAEEVAELGRWPEQSAGGIMTTDFVSVDHTLSVEDTIEEVRQRAHEAEILDSVYVVTDEGRLLGSVSLRALLLARFDERIEDIMSENVISVPPELDQEEVAKTLAKYDLSSLPVVDQNGILLGVITSDDVLDVIAEEQEEDVQKMGAIEPIAERYFDASFLMYVRKRAPWLVILFVGGYFTTSAMRAFDGVLGAVTQLAVYVPLLISAGGNSGSQSSTLVIRGLAVGDIKSRDWWRVLLRESGQGLMLGLFLAAFGVARVLLGGDGISFAVLIAVTIVCIVGMGCVIGGMLPIVLHSLGLDPATSSTPFVSTLVDITGIVIYLGLANWLLLGVLPRLPTAW